MHSIIVKTLTNVRHILDLKKNINISLGNLDSLDYLYSGEGGIIRVKGSSVVMKGKKINGLYFLQVRMVTSSIACHLQITYSDTTKLWHIGLGHMSEQLMYEHFEQTCFVIKRL